MNGGSWSTYTNPVIMSSNGVVEVRATDNAGNVSGIGKYEVTNIDKLAPNAPTFSPSKSSPTNTDVQVTISFPADAQVKEYRVDGGAWTAYTSPINFAQNGKVEARATDNAGNVSSISDYLVTNIDKVAPTNPVISADKTAPTNTDVNVTVSFSNDSVTKQVRVNNGSWVDYSTAITMTQNGTVEARSYDNAGNVSGVIKYNVTNIDKVKPNVATYSANTTLPTNQDVTVTITFPTDVVKKEVRVNGGAWTVYTTPIVMKDNGKVEARGTDNANNVSDVSSYDVTNIDRLAPGKTSSVITQNQNTIKLTGDGDATILYRLNDGEWKEYTETIVINDGTYKVDSKLVDPAKNEGEIVSTTVVMYRDALAEAQSAVARAEAEQTQANVDLAHEKTNLLPVGVPERQPLEERVEDVQDIIEARIAIEKAIETRNETDVQNAKEKLDLLNGQNPIIIDLMDEMVSDFEEADTLALVTSERYDVLKAKYGMTKPSYDALVNIYYAIKYTGDFMYKYAEEKVALVPADDKHYAFVHEQLELLKADYGDFVDSRVQTDAEIKAESAVKSMETSFDPAKMENTQTLINAVENPVIRQELQTRFDQAKVKYEASLVANAEKLYNDAVLAVVKAESTKQSYDITNAYKKVNVLTNEVQKAELTDRLKALEAQIAFDKQVADATRAVENAEKYKYDFYFKTAQEKVTALPDSEQKILLQERLDNLKAGQPTTDQATIIKKATDYVGLAESVKSQYYVDKAQGYINQITDEAKKAELQARLDKVVIK